MDTGTVIENLIGIVSMASLVIIGAGFLIGYFFKSYVLSHPVLSRIVEYVGNVTLARPHNPATNTLENKGLKF